MPTKNLRYIAINRRERGSSTGPEINVVIANDIVDQEGHKCF